MKCKNKKCFLESRHIGKCSDVGPYAINADQAAINNGKRVIEEIRALVATVAESDRQIRKAIGMNRTPNRRDREAYNDYMREYMRKKRKKPLGVPYG